MLRPALILAAAAALAVGCSTPPEVIEARRGVDSYLSGNFPRAIEVLSPLADKTDENYVLNNLRLGASQLAANRLDDAERSYVRAYQIMNATKTNDAGREARAVWLTESAKVWRGEPYERAVANFQLGMIYYARGDYDNARGAFENALFKLRDYGKDEKPKEDQYAEQESDFAIALRMLGRSWRMMGRDDEAARYFERAVALRPDLKTLADQLNDPSNNVLLYVEFGFGPRKIDEGMDGNALDFVPKPQQAGGIPRPRVIVDGNEISIDVGGRPMFDTLAMALDRRWQRFDTIRKTKSYLGTGLLVAGAGTAIYGAGRRDQGTALAGIGILAIGALLKASSEADTRTWEMSPRTAFVIPMKLAPGTHEVYVHFGTTTGPQLRVAGVPVPTPSITQPDFTLLMRPLRWTVGNYAARVVE